MSELGKMLMALGAVLLGLGLVLSLVGKMPGIGHLPGDISIEREHIHFYFPLATCVLLSLVLSFVLWLLRR